MRKFSGIAICVMMGAFFVSCEQGEPLKLDDIAGKYWILTGLEGSEVADNETGDRPRFIHFSDEMGISGFAGCNNFLGKFAFEGNALTISPSATTMMACIPGKDDGPVLQALQSANGAKIESGNLLLTRDGATVATFKPGTEDDTRAR